MMASDFTTYREQAREKSKVLEDKVRIFVDRPKYRITDETEGDGVEYRRKVVSAPVIPDEILTAISDVVDPLKNCLNDIAFKVAASPDARAWLPENFSPARNVSHLPDGLGELENLLRALDSIEPDRGRNNEDRRISLTLLRDIDVSDKDKIKEQTVVTFAVVGHSITEVANNEATLSVGGPLLKDGEIIATVKFSEPRKEFNPDFHITIGIAICIGGKIVKLSNGEFSIRKIFSVIQRGLDMAIESFGPHLA